MSEIKEGTLVKRTYGSGIARDEIVLFLILSYRESEKHVHYCNFNVYDLIEKEIKILHLTITECKECVKYGKYKDHSGWTTELIGCVL